MTQNNMKMQEMALFLQVNMNVLQFVEMENPLKQKI